MHGFNDVSFTGTSHEPGLLKAQQEAIAHLFETRDRLYPLPNQPKINRNRAHHGSCIWADDQFGWIAHLAGYWVEVHPPDNPAKRAYSYYDTLHDEKPYMDRNDDLVAVCQFLIVGVGNNAEVLRSGEWSTARKAKKRGKSGCIVWLDGGIQPFSAWEPRF